MVVFRFKHVFIEAFALHLPQVQVSSTELEDRIAPLYQRLGIPFGTLEKLSGVKSRHLWAPEEAPSEISTVAAQLALDEIGFDRSQVKALFNCSVSRDYFEPATACLVHRNLGLSEDSIAFDVTNACVGFSNGLTLLGNMIDSGTVNAGLLVSGENVSRILESTIATLLKDDKVGRDDLLKILPTFTLGGGAVAFVLCHESIATKGHRLVASVARSATQFNDLCEGNGDYYHKQTDEIVPLMYTESHKLIASAAKLGHRMWKDASEVLNWSKDDVDHIYCHQVGKQVNDAFYKEMGLDISKEFTVYQKYGNLVSAALPAALITGAKEKNMKAGDKVLLTGFGSGLNSIFTGITW